MSDTELQKSEDGKHLLVIDIMTHSVKTLVSYFNKCKHTDVLSHAQYHQDSSYSQIIVESSMTEVEMDKWLYNTKLKIDYVGVTAVNREGLADVQA